MVVGEVDGVVDGEGSLGSSQSCGEGRARIGAGGVGGDGLLRDGDVFWVMAHCTG